MILDYVKHTSVPNAVDTIDKIRTYAVSKGWNQDEWYSGYKWGATGGSPAYGFIADSNHCYLRMSSTGYGTTPLDIVLHTYDYGTVSQVNIACFGTKASRTLDTSNGFDPYRQLVISWAAPKASNGLVLNAATYDELYIIGDDKWICAVMNMDGVYCQFMHFGQFPMFDENCTNGQTYGMTGQNDSNSNFDYTTHSNITADWFHHAFQISWCQSWGSPSWGYACHDIQWDDSGTDNNYMTGRSYSTTVLWDLRLYLDFWITDSTNEPWFYYNNAQGYENWNIRDLLNVNTWSNNRILMRGTYYGKSRIDDTWKPICRTPYHFCKFTGLSIGQTLTYGSDEYLMFPMGRVNWDYGVGFRIA